VHVHEVVPPVSDEGELRALSYDALRFDAKEIGGGNLSWFAEELPAIFRMIRRNDFLPSPISMGDGAC